jgi:hypothetical protein
VKKVWQMVALAALTGVAVNTYADVQNIRLSGDIRLRGYWLDNTASDNQTTDSFIAQRTRISVDADLDDNILVAVTLKAEGLWGLGDEPIRSAGAGSPLGDPINRRFDVGVSEAYVQLSDVFWTPTTLKLGRQYLHYGRGLIISSIEHEYNFDAARVIIDQYPLIVDLVYAKLLESTPFGTGTGARDADLFWANARFELADSPIKNLEAYFGYIANTGNSAFRVPPTGLLVDGIGANSPMLAGGRAEVTLIDGLTSWIEGAYEFGSAAVGDNISAFIANAGFVFELQDVQWSPALNATFTYASGGGSDGKNFFRPWFNYQEGYNGYLFHPFLSNIQIYNLGASVKPVENTTLALQGYYYRKNDKDTGVASDPNIDLGLMNPLITFGTSREVAWEIDAILGYDYSSDVRLQLVYAAFIPDTAVRQSGFSRTQHLVRGEVNVRF